MEAGECKGQCAICPQPQQMKFKFMEETPMTDNINHPPHYTMGKIEVFDFISAWELSFAEGNVVKYVVRSPYKKNRLADLKKARWYLDQLIRGEEQNGDGNN
jgi:hypothetical protein